MKSSNDTTLPKQPNNPNNKELADIEEILKFLPHRYPFLLVDRILKITEGKSIICLKNVTYNEPFFQGHFPEKKIMPGVLVVEALAQAGGILLYNSVPEPETRFVLLSKIDNTKFRKPVVPGDQLRLSVEIVKLKSKFCHVRGIATVDDEVVVEGDIMASLFNKEDIYEER
jgi:3-hydroxyacyl-[acyl-carrier-protein] dehydratase/UDP-3-O-[3-hydroxymyristoyl] N-acetylglucosamine deacetylase/3-hydroxyacyl-[acyl-carrier-protein] dehydratase